MKQASLLLKDRRYGLFYAFTAVALAVLLLMEEMIDGDYATKSDVVIEFLTDIPVFFLLALFIGLIASAIIKWLDEHFSWAERSFRRLIYEISIVILLVGSFTMLTMVADETIGILDAGDDDDDSKFAVITMLMFFIGVSMVFAFHEYISLNEDKDEIQHIAQDLERQNYISRYEALKNQVNPHFLFNSLNVLSSLIYTDISLSDKFIRKFSEVFRYVLELNNQELVTLKREIEFINSYFFLQKIRHEEAISLSIKVSAEELDKLIPPMALQIVVENAFKHNMISTSSPLNIELYTWDHKLIVKNNYQARADSVASTGIGQKNLLDRYKIQTGELPDFYIEDDHYVVELPLLNQTG